MHGSWVSGLVLYRDHHLSLERQSTGCKTRSLSLAWWYHFYRAFLEEIDDFLPQHRLVVCRNCRHDHAFEPEWSAPKLKRVSVLYYRYPFSIQNARNGPACARKKTQRAERHAVCILSNAAANLGRVQNARGVSGSTVC